MSLGQSDLAQTAAADDAGHGRVAENGSQGSGHAGNDISCLTRLPHLSDLSWNSTGRYWEYSVKPMIRGI